MPRPNRITLGGYVYHVMNRANGRLKIFKKHGDFLAFEQILAEAIERFSMRICGYCIMSNHSLAFTVMARAGRPAVGLHAMDYPYAYTEIPCCSGDNGNWAPLPRPV
jgi:hypothetical protein